MSFPRFSIVVPHYQGVVPHPLFLRGVRSLLDQTYDPAAVEILCYHDGPLLDTSVEFPVPVRTTRRRFADWGHSLRDRGIREARGTYVIHFNPDNVLYPHALEVLAAFESDIVVFPVRMMGLEGRRNLFGRIRYCYSEPRNYRKSMVLSGRPPRRNHIDCMQLVMKRELWLREGGWSDKGESADGALYERFAARYAVTYTGGDPLGEHW